MKRSSLYNALKKAIEDYAKSEGTEFSGAFRDALTDLRHMADAEGLHYNERSCAAANVYDEEIEEEVV